ncbi:MAG TPA: Clp1/GlmU family protein [Candidatus Methylomirabilis sp.]|nr:Clp1/GlmU family protein [Candidatus Methylomirabilis sp.]
MTPERGWDRALECAARSRLTLLVGGVDAGKTSLATFLANGLFARGFRVGIVDADPGQSEIGPPTTIGLGAVTRSLFRLGDADLAGLSFVGSTSPQGHVRATIAATQQMTDRAFALGFERVVVDTTGFIEGPSGRILKHGKIERLRPDLVICLERQEECEPILRMCEQKGRPEVLRLAVGAHARRRSAAERRRHRQAALDAYFHDATPRSLSVSALALRLVSDRSDPMSGPDRVEPALVGLDDASGDTLGLGVFRAVNGLDRTLLVDTPVHEGEVAGLRAGPRVFHAVETVR